jgi:outer membrane receptor protein involved in Fe transport
MRALLLSVSGLSLMPLTALAQNVAIDDEIIVTAQKRDQFIQDVPIAITAFDQADLDQLGVQQFDDLADFVPGLEVQEQSANNPGFNIRGITSDSGEATIEPRVAIFQNGVPISRSRGSFVEVFDTDVEVVRGPQPTLFGRSALIGAISLNSRTPEIGETGGHVRFGAGNLGYLLAEGAMSVPLGETAALRLAGRYKERDGYIENLIAEDLNGFQLAALRGSLLFAPNDDLEATLIVDYQEDDNPGTSFKSGTFLPTNADGSFVGVLDASEPAALSSIPGFKNDRPLGLERDVFSATLLVDYALSDRLTLSSVSNYREFDSSEVFDPDGFALPLFAFAEDATSEQFFQEFRLGYEGDRVSGFFGASIFDEEGSQRVPLSYDLRVVQALLGGFLFSAPPGVAQVPPQLSDLFQINVNQASPLFGQPLGFFEEVFTNFGDTTSFDAFGDVTVALTDRLDVTAGLRYTYDDKRTGYSADAPNGPSTLTGAGIFLGANVFNGDNPVFIEDSFDGLTYRLALNYDLSETASLFVNYGHGRRPEVLAYSANVAQPNILADNFTIIDAEETDAFELGYRGEGFDGRFRYDVVGYYYMYENFQTTVLNEAGTPVPVNGGNASGLGFEGSAQLQLSDALLAFGNYAYNGVEFDNEDSDGNPQVRAGNRFRLSPEHAITLGAVLEHEFDFGRLAFSPILAWKSDIFFDDDNDRSDLQSGDFFTDEVEDGYSLLDLRLTFEPAQIEGLTLELFMENVTDEDYLLDAGNTGDAFGIPTFIAGPPRTYGLYLSKTF